MLLFVRHCADVSLFKFKSMSVPPCSDLARAFESCARFLAPLIALCIFAYVDGFAFARFCLSLAWMLKAPAPVAPVAHATSGGQTASAGPR